MADKPVVLYAGPGSTVQATVNRIPFDKELTLDHEEEAPLTALLSRLETQEYNGVEFKFAIGRFAPRTSLANGAVAASAVAASAALVVDSGEYFVEGDVIEIPDTNNDATHTNQLIVTTISGNTLTVKGYDPATYGVSAIDDDAVVRVLSSGIKEGSTTRSARQTVPTVYSQYMQTYEDAYQLTRHQSKQLMETNTPERARLREEARKKHILDHEYNYFLGKKVKDTTSGGTAGGSTNNPIYKSGGLESLITTNALTYGASLTDTELYDFMTDVHSPMYSGGMERLVLASGDLLGQVNKLASSALRITTRETKFGPNITEIQFAGRMWKFIESPVLSEARAGWGFVVHTNFMKKCFNWATTYEMNIQNPKDNFYLDKFYSIDSIKIKMEEVFGVIKP